MNIKITSFKNPFSFFCKIAGNENETNSLENREDHLSYTPKADVSDFDHGQYVAVLWKNKWNRGIISMENQFLIWLVEHGFFLRPEPDGKTVFINLSNEHRRYPTKIFEASVHGVSPVDKIMTDDLQITNKATTSWNRGATEKCEALIASASAVHFVPLALLTTQHNEIVLGDVYLYIKDKGFVNLVDELQLWPVFLEKNTETYIQNLSDYYNTRRKHRACLLKPDLGDIELPAMSLSTTLGEYNAICENAPKLELAEPSPTVSEDGSTCSSLVAAKKRNCIQLTVDEIEMYAHMSITIYDREYNALNVLLNKIADLNMCARYRDHDLKSVGRANHRTLKFDRNDDLCDLF